VSRAPRGARKDELGRRTARERSSVTAGEMEVAAREVMWKVVLVA
jgi:hypothetical protein